MAEDCSQEGVYENSNGGSFSLWVKKGHNGERLNGHRTGKARKKKDEKTKSMLPGYRAESASAG